MKTQNKSEFAYFKEKKQIIISLKKKLQTLGQSDMRKSVKRGEY